MSDVNVLRQRIAECDRLILEKQVRRERSSRKATRLTGQIAELLIERDVLVDQLATLPAHPTAAADRTEGV